MIKRAVFLLISCFLLTSCRTRPPSGSSEIARDFTLYGLSRQTLTVGEHTRTYLLYVPPSLDLSRPVPLILMFHGGGQTPEQIMETTGLNAIADQQGCMVAYPAGSGANSERLYWNVLLSGTFATTRQVDDLGFVRAMLGDLKEKLPMDAEAVYAAGFSQGGMLCYRIACDPELSGQVAAIAVVSATMSVAASSCQPCRPVPLISIHGMRDPYSNFHGGMAEKSSRHDRFSRSSVAETIRFWLVRNELSDVPAVTEQRGTASMRVFRSGDDGVEVISWEIQDGGHTWPGSAARLPEWIIGRVNRDINATILIWRFFQRHRLAPASSTPETVFGRALRSPPA